MTTPFTLTEEQLSAVYSDVICGIDRISREIAALESVGDAEMCKRFKAMKAAHIEALKAMGYPYAIPN